MSKKEETTEKIVALDDVLFEAFSVKLEEAINEVCSKHEPEDARLELLAVLGMFFTQVAIDCGYEKSEFLNFAKELFEDFKEIDLEENVQDKSLLN